MSHDSNDLEMDKLLAELEKEGEESKPIIDKQIKKARDENIHYEADVKDGEEPSDEDYFD